MVLVQVQSFGTGTRYKLKTLQESVKRVKTKSKKVFGANSYVCRSYRGKTSTRGGGGGVGGKLVRTPILNRVKMGGLIRKFS